MRVGLSSRRTRGKTSAHRDRGRHLGCPALITRDGGLPKAGAGRRWSANREMSAAGEIARARVADERADYAKRAERTRKEPRHRTQPMDFYARAYRRIFGGSRWIGRRLMILLAHPFGNANVRAVLSVLDTGRVLANSYRPCWSNASPLMHELPSNCVRNWRGRL